MTLYIFIKLKNKNIKYMNITNYIAYIYLALAFSLNSFGNILLKIGAEKNNYFYLGIGFVMFAMNAAFYFLALKSIPISLAYPIMISFSLMLIASYAFVFLGEQFSYYHLIGYSLIILGVIVTYWHSA
jgi:multidrug transporter EmrE-like cation transporter